MIWNKIYLRLSASFLVLLLALLLAWLGHTKPAHGMEFPLVYTVEGEAPQPVLAPTLEELKKPVRISKPKSGVDNCRQANGTYLKTECSCTCYAKQQVGLTESIGSAKNWRPNSDTPVVGGVIIQSGGRDGHVALVLQVEPTRVYVREANYKPCQISERWLDLNSPNILGFWRS